MSARSQNDAAWKEALQRFFRPFLELLFPAVAAEIDWRHGYEFLDKELGQVTRRAKLGRRHVDVLVRVHTKSGEEAWILIHVEVQSQKDSDFPRRMWVYNYRIYDRYAVPVLSLAVLADADAGWRPNEYRRAFLGCQLSLTFPIVKTLDWRDRLEELERLENPFAILLAAHLHAQGAGPTSQKRLDSKLQLVRNLYDRGLTRARILELFNCMDWFMALSPSLEDDFSHELTKLEDEKRMPLMNMFERRGRKEGRKEGRVQLLLELLEGKFGPVPAPLRARLTHHSDSDLKRLVLWAASAQTLQEFEAEL